MSEFNISEIRKIDGTLLLIFLGLLKERKAAMVAEQLSVTPSTISHALKRLREIFNDDLFHRRPHGLDPTAVALALETPVRHAVETLSQALQDPFSFDPTTSQAIVRVAAYDLELSTLLPSLMNRLADRAPGIRVIARSKGRQDAISALANGEIDMALGYFKSISDDFISQDLINQRFTVVCNKRGLKAKSMTMKRYLSHRHVLVSPGGDLSGVVDDALAELNLTRNVVLSVPLFLPALAAVKKSGLLATVPTLMADCFASSFGLVVFESPLAIPGFTVQSIRHKRNRSNAMIDWIEGELIAISNSN